MDLQKIATEAAEAAVKAAKAKKPTVKFAAPRESGNEARRRPPSQALKDKVTENDQ